MLPKADSTCGIICNNALQNINYNARIKLITTFSLGYAKLFVSVVKLMKIDSGGYKDFYVGFPYN